ncbi:MAG TPA: 4Fe-4S dicluster domain-containing protein [Candidatus Bathyarchaeota archaeon]|nr:4Fe-4S dicluster domain-containing protein [Candidatus Bathyarchaeota archaeon]
MPVKLLKSEDDGTLVVERIMYTKHYRLTLFKDRCVTCELCELTCPREAIKIVKAEDGSPPKLDIDPELCQYCGVCKAICPFGAFRLEINGQEKTPVVEYGSFPELIKDVHVETEKCPVGCFECEEACPLKLIKVRVLDSEGHEVRNLEGYDEEELKVKVDIDLEHCPVCRLCEYKCPYGAIHTQKIIYGSIRMNVDLCPAGCRVCVDACPIPEALKLSEDGKVIANGVFCVYCGACRVSCPVEGAIIIERSVIRHTPVHSGAWNKALEKISSTTEMTKELRGKAFMKVQDSVKRRLYWRLT